MADMNRDEFSHHDRQSSADADPAGFAEHESAPEAPEDAVKRLAAMSPLAYDRVREAEAGALNVRVSTLDAEVRRARGETEDTTHGRRVSLDLPDPWPEPVSITDVLDDIASAIDRHMILAASARDAVALWVAHTWVYRRFDHTPRLAITSPEKRCGKSTLLEVLRSTCRTPIKADNLSASSVFRTVEALAPLTLLVDEADSHLKDNAEELRGVLNSGFEKSGMVIRVTEIAGEHVPVQFATFAPVALAGIKSLPETLEDRSVPIRLERKTADQSVSKLREAGARAALAEIARKLCAWSQDGALALDADPSMPHALNDREGDICVPLIAIADAAGDVWAQRGRRALLHLYGERAADDEAGGIGTMLLIDIKAIFAETGNLRITSAELAKRLGDMEDRPWAEWRQGKPITPTQLARALRPFSIRSADLRIAGTGRVQKGYARDVFDAAWARYIPSSPASPLSNRYTATSEENPTDFAKSASATHPPCSGYENGETYRKNQQSSGVAGSESEFWPEDEELPL